MEEQKVNLETAKLAKEKGFDWDCDHYFIKEDNSLTKAMYYEMDISNKAIDDDSGYFSSIPLCVAPTQSLLQKWLREVHDIHVDAHPTFINNMWYPKAVNMDCTNDDLLAGRIFNIHRKTFEEAFEFGLQETLKLINK